MRLLVARCEVSYSGRLSAYLPLSTRLLMRKADASVLVHADAGGYKSLTLRLWPSGLVCRRSSASRSGTPSDSTPLLKGGRDGPDDEYGDRQAAETQAGYRHAVEVTAESRDAQAGKSE